ncbi:MAG: aldehyde dehydrogenase family protein [Polyangiales bacterium]
MNTYVAGRFVETPSPDGEIEVRSPADLDDVAGRYPWSLSHVDDAVSAARSAFAAWDALGLDARIAHLTRLRAALVAHEDEIAREITREMGKVLREARLEAKALVGKIDLSINEGLAFTRDFTLEDGRLACRFRPHGVMAVIGPFNFPLHLAHGHIAPALLAGNTVVFKPSEVTPGCGALYARIVAEAALPPGVVNVVQGDGRVGAKLAAHPDVDGVLFTGSYAVGTRILRENASRPGRVLALEMGGRNAAVVLDDAPFEKSVADVVVSAFSTSGQRCTCASRLIVTKRISERFIEAVAAMTARVRVGHPSDPSAFMGPLASPTARLRFDGFEALADDEGTRCVIDPVEPAVAFEGRALRGCYVAPRVRRVTRPSAESAYQREEVFGPDLAVWVADDDDHALALANDSDYGLAAGVWTASEDRFERFARGLRVGCVSWNAPTVGSSSRLPFGGLKRSGNHRPAGIFSSTYCAWPLAITRGAARFDPATLPPGIPR